VPWPRPQLRDLDRDGFVDLLAFFRVRRLGASGEDSELCLTGETFAGDPFEGCDDIAVAGHPGHH
jgi:hypothetical protein